MSNVNRVILMGRLGSTPELKTLSNGNQVCNFSLATSESWNDKASGEKKESVCWHNIVVYGKQAENCNKFLSKGSLTYLEGKINNRSYDDKDGNKKYISEIIASTIQFLDKKESEEKMHSGIPPKNISADDLPF